MKTDDGAVPPIVSKRNHFNPADEYVEYALATVPNEFKHQNFGRWLTHYTERVIKGVASDFATAATRGIEQAANLLCDKSFYDSKRKQRLEQRRKFREDMDRQKWERIEQRECPTQGQIEQQLKFCGEQISYHQKQAVAYEKRMEELKAKVPKNVRLMPKLTQ